MSKKTILLLLTSFLSVFLLGIFVSPANAANLPVQGYAWSDNIGWIQFNPTSGGVFLDDSDGNLSGYAWSDNIGWVWFDASDATHPSAKINNYVTCGSSCNVSGWARAIAADNNGWDGWIKMSDTWTNGVTLNKTTGAFSGYAWGSDVVGWVQFNPYVSVAFTPDFSISALPSSQDIIQTDSVGKEYTIRITSLNGFSSAVNLTKLCPSSVGISCSILPTTVTPPANGSVDSKLTVTTSNTPINNYILTVTGASGALTHSASPILNVISAGPPPPPSDFFVTAGIGVNCEKIILSWSDTINETRYEIQRSVNGGGYVNLDTNVPQDSIFYIDSSVVLGNTYAYQIRACNAAGCSAYAIGGSATPVACVAISAFSLDNDGPIWATIVANNNADSTRTIIRVLPEGGFTDPVTLSCPGPEFQCHFSDSILQYIPATGYETAEFWVTVPGSTPKGLYSIIIYGDGGGLPTRQTTVPLNVEHYNNGWDEF